MQLDFLSYLTWLDHRDITLRSKYIQGVTTLTLKHSSLFEKKHACLFYVTPALILYLVKEICKPVVLSIFSPGEEIWGSLHSHVYVHTGVETIWLYACKHICICFYWSHALSSRDRNWFHLCYMSKPFPWPCPGILPCQSSSVDPALKILLAKLERQESVSYFCLVLGVL